MQFCSTCTSNKRGYPRNRLKQLLKANTDYCFSMYVNLANNSSYAIGSLGVYFGSFMLDTIQQCAVPLNYITPHLSNPPTNFITDTVKWILIRGSYTASGNEKYAMLGNFKNDINTDTVFVNPTYLPQHAASYLYDDVSLIELNLPAFAGRDTTFKPGDSLFLGRQPDVGIDEACTWYKLPGTIPIDTIAGFWIKPVATSTYMVRQEICGLVKWDTVVVTMKTLTVGEADLENHFLKIYPSPADDLLSIELEIAGSERSELLEIYNALGECVFKETLSIKNGSNKIILPYLPSGFYILKLAQGSLQHSKSLIIQH
jgi:hypothetical protein